MTNVDQLSLHSLQFLPSLPGMPFFHMYLCLVDQASLQSLPCLPGVPILSDI